MAKTKARLSLKEMEFGWKIHFKKSDDGYLIPNLDESFDRCAAAVMRKLVEHYEFCPRDMRSIVENIALRQEWELANSIEAISLTGVR